MGQESPLKPLEDLAKELETSKQNTQRSQKILSRRKKKEEQYEQKWDETIGKLKEDILAGTRSTGDLATDYVLTHFPFYSHGNFTKDLAAKKDMLTTTLSTVATSNLFWTKETKFNRGANSNLYTLYVLNHRAPWTLTPQEITLHPSSMATLSHEHVFRDGVLWPFLEVQRRKDIVVDLDYAYGRIQLCPRTCELDSLVKELKQFPLAVKTVFNHLKYEVSPEIFDAAAEYTNTVAREAMVSLEESYEKMRASDSKIMKIEEQWNSQTREPVCNIRPHLGGYEPDPVMAKIMSYDTRMERNSAFSSVVTDLNDLHRTGLIDYQKPIRIPVRTGKTIEYNLSEYAQHVRQVLEVSIDPAQKR